MSKKQRLQKKDKQRKAKAKARVVSRREHLRKQIQELKQTAINAKHFQPRLVPIKNGVVIDEAAKIENIKNRLEHNNKILEAIEMEIEKEENERAVLNERLASNEASTLREKMDFMADAVGGKVTENDDIFLIDNDDSQD